MGAQLEDDLQRLLSAEVQSGSQVLASVKRAREAVPFPGVDEQLWMRADVSGRLRNGDEFFIELDATTDPARSVVKYWPYLRSLHERKAASRVHLLVFWSRTETHSHGIASLADFIAREYLTMYPKLVTYLRAEIRDGSGEIRPASEIASIVTEFLTGAVEVEP